MKFILTQNIVLDSSTSKHDFNEYLCNFYENYNNFNITYSLIYDNNFDFYCAFTTFSRLVYNFRDKFTNI